VVSVVVKWAIQCVIFSLCRVQKIVPGGMRRFCILFWKPLLNSASWRVSLYGDILTHVCKPYSLFIFFFVSAIYGRSMIIIGREWYFWTPHNEEITRWIVHFTTIDTNTIFSVLTLYFSYSLYQKHTSNYKMI